MKSIALNGLGRIGRLTLRSLGASRPEWLCAVNDPAPLEQVVQLLRYDSVHGRSALAIDGQTEAGQDYMLLGERREMLDAGLRRLTERERTALLLRDVEGLDAEEVAERLGCSKATVRSHIANARVKFRLYLERRKSL